MKNVIRLGLLALTLALLVGCGADKIDGTNSATLNESLDRMVSQMDRAEATRFRRAVQVAGLNGESLFQVASSGRAIDEVLADNLHGMTAKQIFERAEALQR
ncbi:ABC-type Fe2+-enterobactin transport system substrate-binding protein [Natronocella acetinitrilica]|uniref:ABC-type Fe2+-enterobactin transport system substrate-binding protein n=1 Tax=Natronocella acetinitrilica TaxID=414046 RepID=A0AAE3G4A2_9GAMM|nr:DUF6694 family lipoprotein [Natronocella acetinitrilica]MCP1674486.1 ABC-type Fe2+-enterobactin transport system substrate-binding protein [Natronocella acetinitrilica]